MSQDQTEIYVNFGGREMTESDTQAHFALVGTTGSGKTIQMRLLMQSVLPLVGTGQGYRALVYDAKQDAMSVLSAFCDPASIRNLNPFDDRGVAWDIAADVKESAVAMEVAFTLIPEESSALAYWANASRHITYGVIASFLLSKRDWSLADLLRHLSDSRIARKTLENHPQTKPIVGKYFRSKRLRNDIFSTLATKMLLYEPIAGCWESASERISLQEWSQSEQILVLGNSETSRAAIDNVNRCIFKRASDITLMKPERTRERTWFFIDEVSEAGRLTSLPSLLKKSRSKGGRVAIAFQSISGLRDPKTYGSHVADDILGQIGNRFFGRIECPETAEYASRVIGDTEVQQISRSQSQSRQGSSSTISVAPAVRRAALPSEFMSVEPCDSTNGLTGLFTTRSTLPAWDNIPADVLFDELLIPPMEGVDDFISRDPSVQFMEPLDWEKENRLAAELQIERPRQNQSNDLGQQPGLDDVDF